MKTIVLVVDTISIEKEFVKKWGGDILTISIPFYDKIVFAKGFLFLYDLNANIDSCEKIDLKLFNQNGKKIDLKKLISEFNI